MTAEPSDFEARRPPFPDPQIDQAPRWRSIDRTVALEAAVTVIDNDGLRGLTMRRLAHQLGVGERALHRAVGSRDELLSGVAELLADGVFDDPEVQEASVGWADFLVRVAHSVRRVALAHPQAFPLLTTQSPAAPWVHPPLRSLRWIEGFLVTMRHYGFTDEAAVAAYRAFCSFLLGHLLLEVAVQGADVGPIQQPDAGAQSPPDLTGHPVLAHLQPELARDRADADFEETLETVLDRLELLIER